MEQNIPDYSFRNDAHDFLGRDFLAPTVATLLFPDLLQRMLPVALFNDRAMTLEQSWERGWSATCGKDCDTFSQTFDRLWQADADRGIAALDIPLLLLNSTIVASGKRLIMSPLHFTEGLAAFNGIFNDAVDGRSTLGNQIPLSTVVHLSARFTYVSPAGTVYFPGDQEQSRQWLRLVDGGYFENSGTLTAAELLEAVEDAKKRNPELNVMPFIIHISNDPVKPLSAKDHETGTPTPFMGEVLSPLLALLHVRPARGFQAREALRNNIESSLPQKVRHVHFRLCESDVPLPLGWALSEAVQKDIQAQLPAAKPTDIDPDSAPSYNWENLKLVNDVLGNVNASGASSREREDRLIQSCRNKTRGKRAGGA